MSANAASLPCPICSHTGNFSSAQSLRDRLIFVSTNNLTCPVCQEEVCGLDKLTIHLFSHVKLPATAPVSPTENCDDGKSIPVISTTGAKQEQKKIKPCASKNRPASMASAPMKYVKIYPKPPVLRVNAKNLESVDTVANQAIEECSHTSLPLLQAEKNQVQTNITCGVCGIKFADAKILKIHTCLVHNNDENTTCIRYDCHLCSKNFKMRGSLMVHLRVAHFGFSGTSSFKKSEEKNVDKFSDKNISSSLPSDMNENKQWQCDVCRKCFTTKYFLKKHKRLHTGETPYACTQCNKTFTFQQSYHKHLLYHNDEKPHTCSYCGRAFKELSTLHNHQRIHTGEKPFECETCGKCFRQRVSYLVHRRIHTGVMPYKCTACNKSFRYKVSQRTHKCQAQPPGTVVRKSGDLVEKLKKKQAPGFILNDKANSSDPSSTSDVQQDQLPNFLEVSESNAELVRRGAKLSLEDMESENFTLIADHLFENADQTNVPNITHEYNNETGIIEGTDTHIESFVESVTVADQNLPSPSEILKNLCLSKDEDFIRILDGPSGENSYDTFNNF